MINLTKYTSAMVSGKLLKIYFAVFILIIGLLIVLPLLINKDSIKSRIEQQLSQKLLANVKISGKVSIAIIPSPKITFNDIKINNLKTSGNNISNISIKNAVVKPSLFSLFGKKLTIKKIILESPSVETKHNTIQSAEDSKPFVMVKKDIKSSFLDNIFDFRNEKIFEWKNIKDIQSHNGNFSKIDNGKVVLEFKRINFFIINQLSKKTLNFQSSFYSEDIPTNIILEANMNDGKNSTLQIQSPFVELTASGKFSNANLNSLLKSNFSGQIHLTIIDLKSLLNKFFSKNNLVYHKINATQPISLKANISDNLGKININNIKVISELMSGGGNITADFSGANPKLDIDLDFGGGIDIDSLWFSGAMNSDKDVVKLENKIIKQFLGSGLDQNNENKSRILPEEPTNEPLVVGKNISIFNNLDMSAKIKAKTARYSGSNLQDIDAKFTISNGGDILMESLTATILGGKSLKASGVLSKENNIPKFIGKLEIEGNDFVKSLSLFDIDTSNLKSQNPTNYNFVADILSLPSFTIINNLNLSIDNGKNIVVGNIKIDNSTKVSDIAVNLKTNYFNYDDHFLNQPNPYLSKGSLLRKMLWLNTVNSKQNIYLMFDKLVYKDNDFINQTLRVGLKKGYLKISDIDLKSQNLDIKGNIEIDIGSANPQLNIDIESQNFQYNTTNNINKISVAEGFFNLPSLDKFSGNINLKIANLKINNWQGSDVNISGLLNEGIVNFGDLNLKSYLGDIKYKGSMILKDIKTISGSLEMTGVDNRKFLDDFFNIKNISGISNISATISSAAENKNEFFKNINAQVQFISGNVVVDGFGIYDLAAKMAHPTKYLADLKNPDNILYAENSKTMFKSVAGAVGIQKGYNKNQFRVEVSTVGINGIVSGIVHSNQSLDGNANFIFLSGTRAKQVPINLVVNFKGNAGNIQRSTNFDQVNQYLGQLNR